jgi:D-threonine aldolase
MSAPSVVSDLPTPSLFVDLPTFEANVAAADAMVAGTGTSIRPHVKTHRTPGLALRQQTPGANGVTCATVGEAEAMVDAGIDDVLLANEIVTRSKVERLVALAGRARVAVAVDSTDGLEGLSSAATRLGHEVGILVDVDVGLERCGVDGPAAALDLARAVSRAPGVRLDGLMGYEGRTRADHVDRAEVIARAYEGLAKAKIVLEADGFEVRVVSSAGTSTLHEATADPVVTEVQAGTYALMESDLAGLDLPFRPAVSVSSTVISRAPGRVVLDAGRKSIASDYGPPEPLGPEARVIAFHEEHSTLAWEGDLPPLGSQIMLRPAHVRLTFNLHDAVWLARGDELVECLPVTARGRSH